MKKTRLVVPGLVPTTASLRKALDRLFVDPENDARSFITDYFKPLLNSIANQSGYSSVVNALLQVTEPEKILSTVEECGHWRPNWDERLCSEVLEYNCSQAQLAALSDRARRCEEAEAERDAALADQNTAEQRLAEYKQHQRQRTDFVDQKDRELAEREARISDREEQHKSSVAALRSDRIQHEREKSELLAQSHTLDKHDGQLRELRAEILRLLSENRALLARAASENEEAQTVNANAMASLKNAEDLHGKTELVLGKAELKLATAEVQYRDTRTTLALKDAEVYQTKKRAEDDLKVAEQRYKTRFRWQAVGFSMVVVLVAILSPSAVSRDRLATTGAAQSSVSAMPSLPATSPVPTTAPPVGSSQPATMIDRVDRTPSLVDVPKKEEKRPKRHHSPPTLMAGCAGDQKPSRAATVPVVEKAAPSPSPSKTALSAP